MIQNESRLTLIDVEWRPERDVNGAYHLVVLSYLENFNSKTNTFDIDPNWENPIEIFTTKSRIALVEKLEFLLKVLPANEDQRMLLKRGVVNETSENYRLELLEIGISKNLISNILKSDDSKIQSYVLDHKDITKEILLAFVEKGLTKKIKNKASQKLNSKRFKNS